jgi:uncharacterized protein YkwD
MDSTIDSVNHSFCPYAAPSNTLPLSTALPGSVTSSQPTGLKDPISSGNSGSSSTACVIPIDPGNPAPGLDSNPLRPTPPISPPISPSRPQVPEVNAIAQTLPPGIYDISVSVTASVVPAATATVTTDSPIPSVPVTTIPPVPDPTAAPPPDFVQQVLSLTNQFRTANGVAPLRLNLELDSAALAHSQDMALQDYFDHNGISGSTPISRMNQAGYSALYYGENIAAGYDTPQEVVQGWINSPEHRANLLNVSFTDVGIGYYYLIDDTGINNYYSYWTQNFGSGDLNPTFSI